MPSGFCLPQKAREAPAAERKPRRRQIRIDAASEEAAGWETCLQHSARADGSPLAVRSRPLTRSATHKRKRGGQPHRWRGLSIPGFVYKARRAVVYPITVSRVRLPSGSRMPSSSWNALGPGGGAQCQRDVLPGQHRCLEPARRPSLPRPGVVARHRHHGGGDIEARFTPPTS